MSNWPLIAASRFEQIGTGTGDGTTVSTTTANTKGAYATIGTTAFRWSEMLLSFTSTAADRYRIDIAINTGGSDVVIVADFFLDVLLASATNIGVPLPVRVPSGATVKIRAQANGATRTVQVMLSGYAADFPAAPPAQRMISLTDWTNTLPTGVVTQTGTTFTAWTEIQASTSARVSRIWATITGAGDATRTASQMRVELGFGAAASERAFGGFVCKQGTGTVSTTTYAMPCDIPAASRLSFRVQCSAAAADSFAIACMGLAA